jgi:acetyl-CoA C-acetyltransferase
MTQAALSAAADAGVPSLLGRVQRIGVPQGSWQLLDPGRSVAQRIGATEARSIRFEIGVSQQEIINDALAAIAGGQADVVLVVGGEARAFDRDGGQQIDDASRPPDQIVTRPPDFIAPVEIGAGLVWPVVQEYALIENALAQAEGLGATAQAADIARLWARFNQVARTNPAAAFGRPMDASAIATPGPKNRPLSSPYNRWHSTQWTVDQAGALLFCSTEVARHTGVAPDRWVFPHVALHSSQAITLAARRHLHRWPAMAVLGRAAAHHLGRPLREIELAEIYSCFPAAVRVQQRELELDLDGTPTITGGMAFAGGPFNNFVFQSTAAMVGRLRQDPGQLGLVTTVSGMLSKPGLAVWSAQPPAGPALIADLGAEGTEATATAPVAELNAPATEATVVSSTVTFEETEPWQPTRVAVVLDRSDGTRTAAACVDADFARRCLTENLIGQRVRVEDTTFTP